MRRCLLPYTSLADQSEIMLSPQTTHYLITVLRLSQNHLFIGFNGEGQERRIPNNLP